jgi:ABC-type phosphate transport system substrate-binding protein
MKSLKENFAYILLGLIALVLIFVTISLQSSILSSSEPSSGETPGLIAALRQQLAGWISPVSEVESPDAVESVTAALDVPVIDAVTSDGSTPGGQPEDQDSVQTPVEQSPDEVLSTMAVVLSNAENLTVSEDDNILATVISSNPYAVGFFGYTYYLSHQDTLQAVAIRLPNGQVSLPSPSTVAMGEYPLARPLFLYTSPTIIQAKPEVEALLGCYLNQLPTAIAATNYILPSRELFAQAIQSFDATCQRCRREATTTHPLANIVPSCDLNAIPAQNILIVGSSTVAPLSLYMAELVRDMGFGGEIQVRGNGTGAGFQNFCADGIGDIVDASRPVTGSERERCAAVDRSVLPFPIAVDALAIVVSRDNQFLKDATIRELQQIFAYAKNWSEINPKWPAEPIIRVIPGPQSGSFDYFVEAVMEEQALVTLAEQQTKPLSDRDIAVVSNPPVVTALVDNVVGTSVFVDKSPRVRIGYVEEGGDHGTDCAAITAYLALVLERDFGLEVALQSFQKADDLFNALAAMNSADQVDLTFCYLEPFDRPQRQLHFARIEFIGSGYQQRGEDRWVIMAPHSTKLSLERENRCLYQFLRELDLGGITLSGQTPSQWYEQNQAMITSWLPCKS